MTSDQKISAGPRTGAVTSGGGRDGGGGGRTATRTGSWGRKGMLGSGKFCPDSANPTLST